MKTYTLLLFSCLFFVNVCAQVVPEWEDPRVFAINKQPTRTSSMPYPSTELAIKDVYRKSPWYYSLDGKWQFRWFAKVADVQKDFYREDADTTGWSRMAVPGNWEFNGFGVPMYVESGFGFRARPPYIDRQDSPTGIYRKTFTIPSSWQGRRVFLHFEAGTNSMYVWLNGKKVGYTENSKSPAEFDLSPYLKEGENVLACQVHKFSDGSYLEDQDMWRLGGINRSVYLYATAQTRILDFFAHADLDANYKNGIFSVDVAVKNYADRSFSNLLQIEVLDAAGKSVFNEKKKFAIRGGATDSLYFEGTVKAPLRWTAETPALYTLLLTLNDNQGDVIEVTSHKIGFRKIEIRDGQVLINGKRVLFKGVNLHEFNTKTGQVVDSAIMMRNIKMFKELNINAVRTSHYPQPPLFYKLCDQYGIYLVDEANLESHGLGYGPQNISNFPEWKAAHLDRVQRLVERDKNHPSVIFWSLGNEASNGKAFFDLYDWAKARDKSRPVQYEQAHQTDRNTDIICPMYPSWTSMQRDAVKDLGRPYIMCEYAHAMGNSMGNFQDYWDLIRGSKNMQGGFIWEWYNHGYKDTDEQGRQYWAYGGDLKAHDRMNGGNFCMDGIVSPDQQYLPHTYIVKKVYQDILFEAKDLRKGQITVINDYKFTAISAKDYTFRWQLLKDGRVSASGDFSVDIPADAQKEVTLPFPKRKEANGEYFLQIFAIRRTATPFLPQGFECAKAEFALPGASFFNNAESVRGNRAVEKQVVGDALRVRDGDITYIFYKDSRCLAAIESPLRKVFLRMPRLNFWRAPTDNDFGEQAQDKLRLWEAATASQVVTFTDVEDLKDGVKIRYRVAPKGMSFKVDISYLIDGTGRLTVDAHFHSPGDELPEMMRFGMVMEIDGRYNQVSWYGRGPGESYGDRYQDMFMGIWQTSVDKMFFPYFRPQESGNRTDCRWLTLTDTAGRGIRVVGQQPLSMSALHYRVEDLDPGRTKKQQHPSDLNSSEDIVLNVDLFQRGLGGLNSWGASPLEKYQYRAKEYKYSYSIELLK